MGLLERQRQQRSQLLLRQASRGRRLQLPLFRALAAALVYLGTATGAAASSSLSRVRLNGNGQRGVRAAAAAAASATATADGGGDGSGCHNHKQWPHSATDAAADSGWTGWRSRRTRRTSSGHRATKPPPPAAAAAAAASPPAAAVRFGIYPPAGGLLAFLPGVAARLGAQQRRRRRLAQQCKCGSQRQLLRSSPLRASRRRGRATTFAAAATFEAADEPERRRWPRRATPRLQRAAGASALAAARALRNEEELVAGGGAGTGVAMGAGPGGGAGAAAELPLRRRQRRRSGKDTGDWRPSLYMREGTFQALPYPTRITVMGGGNFGLALSLVLARNEIPTTLLVRADSVAAYVNEHNEHPNYLKGIKLPPHIVATADPKEALSDATFIIHAVPVQYTRKFLENVVQHMPAGTPILSVSKGIETSSLMLMNDILKDMCGTERSYAFLSGPSFAREIAMNQATAVVIASDDSCLANDMAKVLSSPTFRCFTSKDVIGVEVGGAVKNVIALAAGMCEGLGLGTNAMAGLVTRGCGEMRRLAIILGGKSQTLSGLSGVGDTFGTCFGPLSRNRNFGIRLGKGESMEEILASSTEVAEGVDTALALSDLIRKTDKSYRIDLKYAIIFGVADILRGTRSPKEGLEDLMTMPLKAEMYDA